MRGDKSGGYAEALLALAKARNEASHVEAELRVVAQLLKRSGEFRAALKDRSLSEEKRVERIHELLGSGVGELVTGHIIMMIQHGREDSVGDMIEDYLDSIAATRTTIPAEIYSAVSIDETRQKRIENALSARLGNPVMVQNLIDDTLLGGVLIKVGNEVIDYSVRTRLRNLRAAMRRAVSDIGAVRIAEKSH